MSGARGRTGLAVVAALLVVAAGGASAMLLTRSAATFTAATANEGNRISTTSIELTNDAAGALFQLELMAPGDTSSHCIEVTYTGTLQDPSPVRLWSAGQRDPAGLGDHVTIEVEQGAADATCASFAPEATILATSLRAFETTHVDHLSGVGSWVPDGGNETRAYLLHLTLDLDTPNELAGQRIEDLGLVWEITS